MLVALLSDMNTEARCKLASAAVPKACLVDAAPAARAKHAQNLMMSYEG